MTIPTDNPLRRDGFARICLKNGDHVDVPLVDGKAGVHTDGAWLAGPNVYGGTVCVRAASVIFIECWPPVAQAALQAEHDAKQAEEKPSWME